MSIALMTGDQVYQKYVAGEISYWDYVLIYYLLNDYSVQTGVEGANLAAPNDTFTQNGRTLAVQTLRELGRESEIDNLPLIGGGPTGIGWLLPVALGLGGLAVIAVMAKRR